MTDENRSSSLLPTFIKLYTAGVLATDSVIKRRFLDCFIEAWGRVPAPDRDAMMRYFSDGGSYLEVQLQDNHHKLTRGPSGDASAQYSHILGSDEIIYKSTFAKNLTSRSCRYWIAHEIAHLFLHMCDQTHGAIYAEDEREVSELLETRWSFTEEDKARLVVEMYFVNMGKQVDGKLQA